MFNKIKLWLWIILAVLALGWVGLYFGKPTPSNLDGFAQCLAAKNITMYGAYWCSHCQAQKAIFGEAFRFVNYVECTAEAKKCLDNGVSGYPTWILGDGTRLEGERELAELSRVTGCLLPEENNPNQNN